VHFSSVFEAFHTLERCILNWYNARMHKIKIITVCALLLTGSLVSACRHEAPLDRQKPTVTLDGTLQPYPTDTPTATPLPIGYHSPTPSPTVTPTATPVFYEVQQGDDMGSIGWRFNVSPDAIMTANPTVNPRAMSIGTTLIIPVTPMPEATPTETVEYSPTPRAAELLEPDCYPDALGGLWCFVLVKNDDEGALENVTGSVVLEEEAETRQEIAIMPLNLLPAGESLPLIAYFQPPVAANYIASAQIDFLLPVMPNDQRYLTIEIVEQFVSLDENGRVAQVSGKLFLPEGQPDTRYLWVNATGFDEAGRVVSVRRWDSPVQLSSGESTTFELNLYSMGGVIDYVDFLVEARSSLTPVDEE
jgi:LysM repeat protein